MLDILVVDDDDIVRQSVIDALVHAGHRVAEASDGVEALALFAAQAFDVAICDVHMPRMDGLTLCRRLRRESPGTALVIMTSFGNVGDAVASLRGGVVDYVSKPFDPDEFASHVLGPIAERHALRKKFEETRTEMIRRDAGATLIGASLVMRQLGEGIALAAKSDASVLVTGERGTGRKLVARTIHAQSPRREGPLVIVPCAALPDLVVATELEELAELRPRQHRDSWFRAASGGTLVLDGVELLSGEAQETLVRLADDPTLRARRDRDWQPLGVRVVSLATEAGTGGGPSPLPAAMRLRFDCMKLRVPALRERDGDLYGLVCHFLRDLTPPARSAPGLTPDAWRALAAHTFRGNLRELSWALEHAVARADGNEIDVGHLPDEVRDGERLGIARDPCRSTPW